MILSPSPVIPSSVPISRNSRYLPPLYGGMFSITIVLTLVTFNFLSRFTWIAV